MPTARAIILRVPGTNCDAEAAYAFELAGAKVDRVHIGRVREKPAILRDYQIMVLPGGFSYGDDVSAGKILATQLQNFLAEEIRVFRAREKLILGICNGFQTLLKAGIIVPHDEEGPLATLADNDSGLFEDRWIHLRATPGNCPFLKGVERLFVPVAHGEGRFVCRKEWILRGLEQAGQVVLRYRDASGNAGPYPVNPNGSQGDIAGVCDSTGRVLGLMPHPERHALPIQHPSWTRNGLADQGDGMKIFRNAVAYFDLA